MQIYTLGHSLRPMEEVCEMLDEHRAGFLADVRRFPGERKNPGFGQEAVEKACLQLGVTYVALGRQLGGGRTEGYQAYLKTDSFEAGLNELVDLARRRPTVVFCREAFYFRCHRKYLSDELVRAGWTVNHLLAPGRSLKHRAGSYRMSPLPDDAE